MKSCQKDTRAPAAGIPKLVPFNSLMHDQKIAAPTVLLEEEEGAEQALRRWAGSSLES